MKLAIFADAKVKHLKLLSNQVNASSAGHLGIFNPITKMHFLLDTC